MLPYTQEIKGYFVVMIHLFSGTKDCTQGLTTLRKNLAIKLDTKNLILLVCFVLRHVLTEFPRLVLNL